MRMSSGSARCGGGRQARWSLRGTTLRRERPSARSSDLVIRPASNTVATATGAPLCWTAHDRSLLEPPKPWFPARSSTPQRLTGQPGAARMFAREPRRSVRKGPDSHRRSQGPGPSGVLPERCSPGNGARALPAERAVRRGRRDRREAVVRAAPGLTHHVSSLALPPETTGQPRRRRGPTPDVPDIRHPLAQATARAMAMYCTVKAAMVKAWKIS